MGSVVPKAQAQADILARQWMQEGGLQTKSITWLGFEESHLPCAEQSEPTDGSTTPTSTLPATVQTTNTTTQPPLRCEEHIFRISYRTQLKEGTSRNDEDVDRWAQVTVVLDPRTGLAAGVHLLPESTPTDSRPVWNNQPGYRTRAELPEVFDTEAVKWAKAWTIGDQDTIRQMTGYVQPPNPRAPLPEYQWLGEPGWVVVPPGDDSVEVLGAVGIRPKYIATVAFSVAKACIIRLADAPSLSPDTAGTRESNDNYYMPACDLCPKWGVVQDENPTTDIKVPDYVEYGDLATCRASLPIAMDIRIHVEDTSEYKKSILVEEYGPVGSLDPKSVYPQEDGSDTPQSVTVQPGNNLLEQTS